MEKLYAGCRALFDVAFPGEDQAWCDALFSFAFPKHLRVIAEGDTPKAMLFALPYETVMADGEVREARYVYAVATAPACRGQGLATRLLQEVAAEGVPFFLRPMEPSLFAFYAKAGLSPISYVRRLAGESAPVDEVFPALTPEAYLALRAAFLKPPYARPVAEFLKLGFLFGGAVGKAGEFAAFYEKRADYVYFKEWLGDVSYAPRVAASLGFERYVLRTPCAGDEVDATPFGMAVNCPKELCFLIALD